MTASLIAGPFHWLLFLQLCLINWKLGVCPNVLQLLNSVLILFWHFSIRFCSWIRYILQRKNGSAKIHRQL